MRYTTLLTSASAALLPVDARVVHDLTDLSILAARAFPANQPHGYTPQVAACPSDGPTIRHGSAVSPNETAWLQLRRQATIAPMRELLARCNITGLDTDKYISDHSSNTSALPNIGLALSGGGYRAMLNGAGHVQAWDSRTPNATAVGQLGGLLQASTYLAGLSGGNWAVGSLYSNNFTSVDSILAQDTDASGSGGLWQLGNSIFEGPATGGIQLLDSVGYYAAVQNAVSNKGDNFNVTITDYWGRTLSYQLVNATDGGPAYTFSSIAEQDWFTSGSVPLPLLVADGRAPGEALVPANTTVFTFNPWELGSADPTLYAWSPLKYIGTNFTHGGPLSNDKCVTGFDNVGFVMGTSSSLFNSALSTINQTDTTGLLSSALQSALENILTSVGQADDDIADYPNPFYNASIGSSSSPLTLGAQNYATDRQLTLVDGGEDGQNIPLHPLVQPDRHVDVIFAVDSSADTNATLPTNDSATGWPDGFAIMSTYRRSLATIQNGTIFPSIPDTNTFFNLGLNTRPTFFGCDANNFTGPTPLIVYLPNAPYVYNSNVSTYDLKYNNTERNAIVLNGYNGATQGNGTLDAEWSACVGCAILSRSLARNKVEVPEVCTTCFSRYCWDGTVNATAPARYVPAMKLAEVKVSTSAAGVVEARAAVAVVAAVVLGVALL